MTKWIKRLFCNHFYRRIRTVHGDEINHRNGYRSEWQCNQCGKRILSKYMFTSKKPY